ncbi:hypothetical protein LTR37_002227 [Vermiconidia calcicola]|uniref:Uncharacterized protein n=1 Tax=Vermiconidia calcicola TaxID=1690605 RepID=A0ACC3NUQ3_9PEZI|nr:hypothetical protein LTR37_002227 [Vermiconidia calcicola]
MAAPRATQFIALRNLSRTAQQVRNLSMTGPATYVSPVLTKERSVLNLPRDIAGLRAECKRRKIEASGSKQDLITRLNADELTHSRAFATAATSNRPTASTTTPSTTRHFNTTRTLKAVNDTSTIDFAFLPQTSLQDAIEEIITVPIIPTNYTNASNSNPTEDVVAPVMKAEVSTMSADTVFLPMAEMSDGHAQNIDFHAMAEGVGDVVKRVDEVTLGMGVGERTGMMRRVLGDIADDLLGVAGKKKAAT